jgi:hypothetical protein
LIRSLNALGGAKKPTAIQIRSELVAIGIQVETLENSQTLAEKDARISDLEAELHGLEVALNTANSELNRFREEQTEREKRETEINDTQFEILKRLPSKHGGTGLTMLQMWRETGQLLEELEIHVDWLERNTLIDWHVDHGEKHWRRTILGNKLIVAKRLAGEEVTEEQPRERYKYPNLPEDEDWIVEFLNSRGGVATLPQISDELDVSLEKAEYLLRSLEKKSFVRATLEVSPAEWWLLDEGADYLGERDRL